ncbi:hypothetical protein AVEN_238962-1 [Araneus ventricosus]|uniref:Uncharacterized protein n=1 Tax=Araneus ventricosus TaxID=182803 RepID=A0A4Y2SXJ0_ARAVE|nr:hypothetical protein AVEN_238962-1 [Araneus ventricosus]
MIEEVNNKVQGKIGDIEKSLSDLEIRPDNFPVSPEVMYSRPTVKSLTIHEKTSWTVFKAQFDVVISVNGWSKRVKANETAKARRKPSGISRRCGESNEPGIRRVPSGCLRQPSSQYFVDTIRDEETQQATRLMDAKDLKSALGYSMKYEAAKTVSKISRNVRLIEIEDGAGKEKD